MRLNRIGVKLILTAAAILAIEAGVRSYFETSSNARHFRDDFMTTGRVHATSVAQAAEYGFLTRDAGELNRVADMLRMGDDADLLYVAFYDENGKRIASRRWSRGSVEVPAQTEPVRAVAVRGCEVPGHPGGEHYLFCVPVEVSRAIVGVAGGDLPGATPGPVGAETAMVVVARSYGSVRARVGTAQRETLLLSMAVFGVFLLALLVLGRRLVVPIRQLAQGTERIAKGDFGTRVDVGRRRDEFGVLAERFNRMVDQLREQRGQILSYSRDLERKVGERTAELGKLNEELNETNRRLQELATTDELTGLWNRRRFFEVLRREFHRVRRHGTDLALAMFDLDHFKVVNDTYGHTFGDRVLVEVAKAVLLEVRETDVAARYGGEEFVVLMPSTSSEEAMSAVERIRKRVAQRYISDGKHAVRVTLSAGVSAAEAQGTSTPEALLRLADEALYAAKHAGRDCVRTWHQICVDQKEEVLNQSRKVDDLQRRMTSLSARSKDVFVEGSQGLVQALEARDPYRKSHSENVTRYAVAIAGVMGLDAEETATIRRAAVLHDIGTIGVADAILRKPGKLTAEERRVMEGHVLIGVRMLDQMHFLDREISLVRHHHERWDGCGYPDGLQGEAIPRGARILAVADALDAVVSDRVYRGGGTVMAAIQTLQDESGRQFDPAVVDALVRWVVEVGRGLGTEGAVTCEDLMRSQQTTATPLWLAAPDRV